MRIKRRRSFPDPEVLRNLFDFYDNIVKPIARATTYAVRCTELNETTMFEWTPPLNLTRYFIPTRFDKSNEIKKADIKNHNLPILQYWYNGDPNETIKCLISDADGFEDFENIVTKDVTQRFTLDFNHIRQKHHSSCHSGFSIDKECAPSDIFRRYRLDNPKYKLWLIEMMAIIPMTLAKHKYISNDSSKADITLSHFRKQWWPWGLKTKENFDEFCKKYHLNLDYDKFIALLSDINVPKVKDSYNDGRLSP